MIKFTHVHCDIKDYLQKTLLSLEKKLFSLVICPKKPEATESRQE